MPKQAKPERTPSGKDFMKATSIDFLKKAYKKEKRAKPKIRIAAAILRKQGCSYAQIKQSLNISRSTISDWIKRMDGQGIAGAYSKKIPGRNSRLDKSQLVRLRNDLVQNPQSFGFSQSFWTTQMILEHVKKRYGTRYVARGMRDLLHKIGFSITKPRPLHYKSASESEKKRFKKKQEGPLQDTQNVDMRYSVWTSRHL